MSAQSDLFEHAAAVEASAALPPLAAEPLGDPIAIPCGFMDRTNGRIRRLAVRPVMVDGFQLVCRERPMLHCDPACFTVSALEPRSHTDAAYH